MGNSKQKKLLTKAIFRKEKTTITFSLKSLANLFLDQRCSYWSAKRLLRIWAILWKNWIIASIINLEKIGIYVNCRYVLVLDGKIRTLKLDFNNQNYIYEKFVELWNWKPLKMEIYKKLIINILLIKIKSINMLKYDIRFVIRMWRPIHLI